MDFDISPWFIHERRICELIGPVNTAGVLRELDSLPNLDPHLKNLYTISAFTQILLQWAEHVQPKAIGELLLSGQLAEGVYFTHYGDFYCRGLSPYIHDRADKKTALPSISTTIPGSDHDYKLIMDYHPEHLVSDSAWDALSGRKRHFVIGVITRLTNNTIEAKPYVIGLIVSKGDPMDVPVVWQRHREILIEEISSFARVKDIDLSVSTDDLKVLRDIPEEQIKMAFAEIIGEPDVEKDWGGESSDLYTARLIINGRRTTSAFLFKGPSQFKPMTVAALGKNGDQIVRLYDEPAELLLLQHCHKVTPAVRKTMRAFAENINRLRQYCIIDGYCTLRILSAYGKCGL